MMIGRSATRRWLAALAAAAGFGLAHAAEPARAAPSSAASSRVVPDKEAREWLKRIQQAPATRNYQGTFVVSAGGSLSSARLTHYHARGSQFEMVESLDGQARHVFRHDDLIQTVWPHSRLAVIEQRDKIAVFPALLRDSDSRIVEFYEIRLLGADRVAGRTADVLTMKPRDGWRFGNRLWADRETGLLLRAEVLNGEGHALESSAFSEVTIGVRPKPEQVLDAMSKLEGYRIIRPALTPAELDQEGWVEKNAVPGFRRVSCIKRPLHGAGDNDTAAPPQVLQTVYSDGLTHVSIFIEPYSPQRHVRPVLTSIGATHTLMLRKGDWWFTVVGDVPVAALKAFAMSVERKH